MNSTRPQCPLVPVTTFLPAHDWNTIRDTMPPMYATPTDIRSMSSIRASVKSRHRYRLCVRVCEILCRVRPCRKVGRACTHAAWPRICCDVCLTVGCAERAPFVSGQIVPEVGEIGFFASSDERFRGRTVKPKVPHIVVVVRELPSFNTGKESVHNDELLDFCGELCGIGVCNH